VNLSLYFSLELAISPHDVHRSIHVVESPLAIYPTFLFLYASELFCYTVLVIIVALLKMYFFSTVEFEFLAGIF